MHLKTFFRRCCASLLLLQPLFTLQAAQWQAGPPLSEAVQEIYPVLHDGQLVVAGGISSQLPAAQGQMSAQLQRFDLSRRSWQAGPALPEGRHHALLISTGTALFAFGGFVQSSQGQWTNSADVLRLQSWAQGWQKVAQLPQPLIETVGAYLDGKIHLAGGRSPLGPDNGQWQHSQDVAVHFVFDPVSLQFSTSTPLPSPRNSAATVLWQGRWLVIGGRTVKGGNLTDVLAFEPKTASWQALPPLPEGRAGHAAAVLQQQVLVFGGEYFDEKGGGVYAKVWQLASPQGQWQQAAVMPQPRHGLGAVAAGDHIWLIGGATQAGLKQTTVLLEQFSLAAPGDTTALK